MPRRLKISSPRNSECAVPLTELDWNRWFTDGIGKDMYLHVQHQTEPSSLRVYCRASDSPRLESRDGRLYWLID